MRITCLLPLLLVTGCCCGPTSLGWRFEVGRAPSISVPAMLSQQPGLTTVSPVAAYPSSPAAGPTLPLQLSAPVECLPAPRPHLPATLRHSAPVEDPCSCEALLRRLEALEARTRAAQLNQEKEAMRMK